MHRRNFLGLVGLGSLVGAAAVRAESALRFGLTPVFLDDRLKLLGRWRRHLETVLGRPVEFVQHGTYEQVVGDLRAGRIDVAWICGYPFVLYARELSLVAVPVWRGQPLYRSYLIAGERSELGSLIDLRGRNFAYSDPLSNSGYLYVRHSLAAMGERPDAFFGRTFFSYSHRHVVEAVAEGLADAGAVDGYVWETLAEMNSGLARRTRVIERSPEFGFPPIAARPRLPADLHRAVQGALLAMHRSAEGRAILGELRLDRLVAGSPRLFDSIAKMARRFD